MISIRKYSNILIIPLYAIMMYCIMMFYHAHNAQEVKPYKCEYPDSNHIASSIQALKAQIAKTHIGDICQNNNAMLFLYDVLMLDKAVRKGNVFEKELQIVQKTYRDTQLTALQSLSHSGAPSLQGLISDLNYLNRRYLFKNKLLHIYRKAHNIQSIENAIDGADFKIAISRLRNITYNDDHVSRYIHKLELMNDIQDEIACLYIKAREFAS